MLFRSALTSGPNTVTFVENDTIDITFVDEAGNEGHQSMTVDWIDREEPTGTVTYSTNDITDEPVVATLEPSEEGVTILSEGGDTHTFDSNGTFTFELMDAAGNVGTVDASVHWIKHAPTVEVSFSKEAGVMTKGTVDATVTFPEGYRIMNNGGSNTHTFTKNGEFVFQYIDPDGMQGSYPVVVDWIDNEAPTATITYDNPTATNKNVIATITLEDQSGPVTITSEGGNTHTFTENGEFTFAFEDNLGNKGTATAVVDWIDKDAPTAIISYNTTDKTKDAVIATLESNETITITNTDGVDISDDGTITHTFTENGEFVFEFEDAVGNKGTATAKVDWIEEGEPENPGGPDNPGGSEMPDPDNPEKPDPGKPDNPDKPGNPSGSETPDPDGTEKPDEKPTPNPGPGDSTEKPGGDQTLTPNPGDMVIKPGDNSPSGGSAGLNKPGHSDGTNSSKPSKKPGASVSPQSDQSDTGNRSTNSAPDLQLPLSGNNSSVSTPNDESNSTVAEPESITHEGVTAGTTDVDTHQNETASPIFLDTDAETTRDDDTANVENTEEKGVNWLLILIIISVPAVATLAFFVVRAMRTEK